MLDDHKNTDWIKKIKVKLIDELTLHKDLILNLLKWLGKITLFIICLFTGLYLTIKFGFDYNDSIVGVSIFDETLPKILGIMTAFILYKLVLLFFKFFR